MKPILELKTAQYLQELLKTIDPQKISDEYVYEFGVKALHELTTNIELENEGVAKNLQKRLPTQLTSVDCAVLLVRLYDFRKVHMSNNSKETLLSVYDRNTGLYRNDREYFEYLIKLISPNKTMRQCEEVLSDIKTVVSIVHRTDDKNLIAVENGIFNKKTKELEPFTSEYIFFSKLAIKYNESIKLPRIKANDGFRWDVEKWLTELANGDKEVTTLFWQVIADSIQGNFSRGKAIFFYSQSGNNGKGTIGQLIKNILGKGNYCSLSIDDFRQPFLRAQLVNTIANICDENNVDQYIDSVRDFKASITGDDIIINGKFEKPFPYQFRGSNIQMINGLPRTRDKSDSFYRRIILVPFLKSFQNNGERKEIKIDYIARNDVLEYVLKKALLMDFDEYIIPKISLELMDEYKEVNNSVLKFWKEMKTELVWDFIPKNFLYDLYKSWFYQNIPSGRTYSKQRFYENISGIIGNDNEWTLSDNPVSVQKRMDADEPLITEYNLENWQDHRYTGNEQTRIRNFERKDRYRGIWKV
ncbi:DNA primase family protein [Enterococcus sp. DIV0170]|uniref:DNA primase family protein n=1 Tax=Enterococcus sp. DIV0170 TaxID=2774642 RepID=UPI003F1EA42F